MDGTGESEKEEDDVWDQHVSVGGGRPSIYLLKFGVWKLKSMLVSPPFKMSLFSYIRLKNFKFS
jgi:hypothetical protein